MRRCVVVAATAGAGFRAARAAFGRSRRLTAVRGGTSAVSPAASSVANAVPTWTVSPTGTSNSWTMPSCQHSTPPRPWWSRPPPRPGRGSQRPRAYEPFVEGPLVHVRAQRRHLELDHRRSPKRFFTAATILSGCSSAACSRCLAYGIGTSALQTRAIGASRSKNAPGRRAR